MAAIAIGDCTVSLITPMAGANLYSIVTPATADDGDTVDISTICKAGEIYFATCQGATDGNITAAFTTAGVVTIPGSTDNEARTIFVLAQEA